ncbi:hypothetical protein BH18ACT4_BH18ACT4_00960 [soil metagenome]
MSTAAPPLGHRPPDPVDLPANGARASAEPARAGRREPLERALAWGVVVFLSVLTLEWVTLRGVAGGFIKPFHVAGLILAVVALARWRPRRFIGPMLRRYASIYGAYFLLLAVSLAGGLAYTAPYLSRATGLRQVAYAAMSVVLAGVLANIATSRRAQRILAWTGAATVGVVVVGLVTSLAAGGTNPLSVLREALAKGDPDIVSYQLLRVAFRSEDLEEVGANLRHKVFIAVLLGTLLGLAFLPVIRRGRRIARAVLVTMGAAGCALVVLSLSRSAIVCVVFALMLAPLRGLVSNRARTGQMVLAGLSALVAVALAVSPVATLLTSRFGGTGSYEARLEGAGPKFLEEFLGAALIGSKKLTQSSPHNFALDAWLSGGVIAFVCALVLLFSYGRLWVQALRRYLTSAEGWFLPVNQLWVVGLGVIPLVRAVTAGNQFHMVEWATVGAFLGLIEANRRASVAASTTEPPAAFEPPWDPSPGDAAGVGTTWRHAGPRTPLSERASTP